MKTHRTTYTLLLFFFASLFLLWALDYFGIRPAKEQMLRDSLLLPELLDHSENEIRRISIERGTERLVFEKRGRGVSRWQMVEPVNVAALRAPLETLVLNLKGLRRSVDAGGISGDPSTFGLDNSAAIVRLWAGEPEKAKRERPAAGIDRDRQDSQPAAVRSPRIYPGESIEVADARLLSAVRPATFSEWRERLLLGIPTYQVASVAIKRGTDVDSALEPQPAWAIPPGGTVGDTWGRRPEGREPAGRARFGEGGRSGTRVSRPTTPRTSRPTAFRRRRRRSKWPRFRPRISRFRLISASRCPARATASTPVRATRMTW